MSDIASAEDLIDRDLVNIEEEIRDQLVREYYKLFKKGHTITGTEFVCSPEFTGYKIRHLGPVEEV